MLCPATGSRASRERPCPDTGNVTGIWSGWVPKPSIPRPEWRMMLAERSVAHDTSERFRRASWPQSSKRRSDGADRFACIRPFARTDRRPMRATYDQRDHIGSAAAIGQARWPGRGPWSDLAMAYGAFRQIASTAIPKRIEIVPHIAFCGARFRPKHHLASTRSAPYRAGRSTIRITYLSQRRIRSMSASGPRRIRPSSPSWANRETVTRNNANLRPTPR